MGTHPLETNPRSAWEKIVEGGSEPAGLQRTKRGEAEASPDASLEGVGLNPHLERPGEVSLVEALGVSLVEALGVGPVVREQRQL